MKLEGLFCKDGVADSQQQQSDESPVLCRRARLFEDLHDPVRSRGGESLRLG